MEKTRILCIPLTDLTCGEAKAVEHLLAAIGGVMRAYVNPVTATAYLEHDPFRTGPGALLRAVRWAGHWAGRPAG